MGTETEETSKKVSKLPMIFPIATAGALGLVAGFTLLQTNALGVRDKLNVVGQNLGNMVPQLKGPMELLRGLAGAFGLSGESATEWNAALARGMTEIMPTVSKVAEFIRTALNEMGYAFDSTVDAWNSTVDAFNSSIHFLTVDIPNAITGIGKSVTDLGTALGTDASSIWDNFVEGAKGAASSAWDGITSFLCHC